jgi:hypothetical protein
VLKRIIPFTGDTGRSAVVPLGMVEAPVPVTLPVRFPVTSPVKLGVVIPVVPFNVIAML